MINIFKNRLGFYIKTLLVYGILLALLHCPSMQREKKYHENDKLEGAEEFSKCTIGGGTLNGYPIARMLNLIEQCRSIDTEFHGHKFDLSQYYEDGSADRINKVKHLHSKVVKVTQKLREERVSFTDFIAGSQNRGREKTKKVSYLCSKGKCRYTTKQNLVLSRKEKEKKASRYASQVLNKYLKKLVIMDQRLNDHIERVRLKDAAVKARSEDAAKKIVKTN